MLLISSNNGLDPYDYHLCKNVLDCFKKLLGCNQIHSSWPGEKRGSMEESVENEQDVEEHVEQDVNIHELEYNDGSNEVVKVFNQKCVIYFKRDSDYKFWKCGQQCFCEESYQNKGDTDISICVVCRT